MVPSVFDSSVFEVVVSQELDEDIILADINISRTDVTT